MTTKKILSALSLSIALTACSTTPTSNPANLAKMSAPTTASLNKNDIVANSNVIFVRPNAFVMLAAKATIHIDGKKVLKLKNDQFSAINLDPGDYTVKISFPVLTGMPSKTRQITKVEGETIVLGIDMRLKGGGGWLKTKTDFNKDPAELVICCTYNPPLID